MELPNHNEGNYEERVTIDENPGDQEGGLLLHDKMKDTEISINNSISNYSNPGLG